MEIREDKMGNDYRVILRRGGEILVDAKNRDRGCSRFWKCGPEFALEKWSVLPENGTPGKTGWTLCERKQTDLIFFKFYPEDSTDVFLVSYQLLRVAFRRNLNLWENQFQVARQSSGAWKSECVFVPASIVFCAINDISVSRLVEP